MGRLADRAAARARLKRRMYPIHGYTGPNGTGKSAIMVMDTLPTLEQGRPVLSTVRLLDYRRPRDCEGGMVCDDPANHEVEVMAHGLVPSDPDDPGSAPIRHTRATGVFRVHAAAHPLYVPFRDFGQLWDWRDGDVLMDEVTGVASSRESSGMPPQIANMLVQLRRRNIALRWSAPAWGRADKIIREVSQGVTLMTASMPKRAPASADGQPRMWLQRRLFTARTYDPAGMDEFEAHRAMAEEIRPEIIAFYWGPGSTMFRAYDTYDAVSALSHVEAGTCLHCGGKRTQAKCMCSGTHESPSTGGAARRKAKPTQGPTPTADLEPVPA